MESCVCFGKIKTGKTFTVWVLLEFSVRRRRCRWSGLCNGEDGLGGYQSSEDGVGWRLANVSVQLQCSFE